MNITVSVPVKAYLKRYVLWRHNLQSSDVLDLNQKGELSMVLLGLLEGTLTIDPGDLRDFSDYDDELFVRLTKTKYNRNLLVYTGDNIRWLNSYLYLSFHDYLLHTILVNRDHGVPESDTIYSFMDVLDLYDEITFDALKKASYRLRKERNMSTFRCAGSRQVRCA